MTLTISAERVSAIRDAIARFLADVAAGSRDYDEIRANPYELLSGPDFGLDEVEIMLVMAEADLHEIYVCSGTGERLSCIVTDVCTRSIQPTPFQMMIPGDPESGGSGSPDTDK